MGLGDVHARKGKKNRGTVHASLHRSSTVDSDQRNEAGTLLQGQQHCHAQHTLPPIKCRPTHPPTNSLDPQPTAQGLLSIHHRSGEQWQGDPQESRAPRSERGRLQRLACGPGYRGQVPSHRQRHHRGIPRDRRAPILLP